MSQQRLASGAAANGSASERAPLLGDADNSGGRGGEPENAASPAAVPAVVVPDKGKPMPKRQVALLCFARLIEPIAFFSVFPYINQMVKDNGDLPYADVGFYSGLIESLFSLTQAVVMLGWGRAADHVGRKPVLVLSLIGMSGGTALFGLAQTLPQMIAFRCLAGVFAGTIVTIRTMLAEHSTAATQARIFSWFAFSGNLGIFLGPLLGGALADPLRAVSGGGGGGEDDNGGGGGGGGADGLLSRVLSLASPDVPFLAAYPYALPAFAVAGLGFLAALTCALFVEETLVPTQRRGARARSNAAAVAGEGGVGATGEGGGGGGGGGGEPANGSVAAGATAIITAAIHADSAETYDEDTSLWRLVRAPGVGIVLFVYGHVMLLAFAYTAICPVFWFTPVDIGGLGFTSLQISIGMGIAGAGQALWLLLAFPPLQHRLGTNGVMRLCGYAYPWFMACSPLAAMTLRYLHAPVFFWVVAPPVLAIGSGVSMCFTAVQLAVNDVAPSPHLLGTLNALALTGVSAIRAFAPALFTSLFALSARTQWLAGYAIWVLMVALAAAYTVVARHLPDYEALKKARQQQQRGGGGAAT